MKKYNIGGVVFGFDFIFNSSLTAKIKKYETLYGDIKYQIKSLISNNLTVPVGNIIYQTNNKLQIKTPHNKNVICFFDKQNNLIVLVSYPDNYQTVEITFKKGLDNIILQEYVITGIIFNAIMARENMITFHASAISFKNEGILFSAPSGTGKSTHSNLWTKYKENVVIINDDKPLLKFTHNNILVVGSPWSGKTSLQENIMVPLKSICFLNQSKTNYIVHLENNHKLIKVIKNIYRPLDDKLYNNILHHLDQLITTTPMYQVGCDISKAAVEMVFQKLYKE